MNRNGEIVHLPYSVYSHDRCKELLKLLEDMGYIPAKTYPDGKPL